MAPHSGRLSGPESPDATGDRAPGPERSVADALLALQRTAGNRAVSQLIARGPPTTEARTAVGDAPVVLTPQQLWRHVDQLEGLIARGQSTHDFLIQTKREQPIVSWFSDLFGGAKLPPRSIWNAPRFYLRFARRALSRGNYDTAIRLMVTVEETYKRADARVHGYVGKTIKGGERVVKGLRIAATVGEGTASVIPGPVGAALRGAYVVAEPAAEAVVGSDPVQSAGLTPPPIRPGPRGFGGGMRFRGRGIGGKTPPRGGRGFANRGPDRPSWADAPDTGGLRGHAQKHGGKGTIPREPQAYYDHAVKNMNHGQRFNYRHGGQGKRAYVTTVGDDRFVFTGTSRSGRTIFTHMEVKGEYLKNLGITLSP